MNNYLKIHLNDYDNFCEINEKINNLKTVLSKNENLVFELNNEIDNKNIYINNELSYNSKNKKRKTENIIFYINMSKDIFQNSKKELDDKCFICYELLSFKNIKELICEHNLCFDCYQKWNKICLDLLKLTNCPICRKIIT